MAQQLKEFGRDHSDPFLVGTKMAADHELLTPEQKTLVLPMPKEELYDLEVDPYEVNNLAINSEYVSELRMMQEKLETWQRNVTDYGMQEDSESLKYAFKKYGIQSSNKYSKKIAALESRVREDMIYE